MWQINGAYNAYACLLPLFSYRRSNEQEEQKDKKLDDLLQGWVGLLSKFSNRHTERRLIYVAAKATYIRLFHGKIGILEGFFGPISVHRGRTHIVLGWNM